MEAMVDALQTLRQCKQWTAAQRGELQAFVEEAARGRARTGGEAERTWERLRGALFVLMGRGSTPRLVPTWLGGPLERLDATLIVDSAHGGCRRSGAVALDDLSADGFVRLGTELLDACATLHDRLTDCATVYTLSDACSAEAPQWAVTVCTEVGALREAVARAQGAAGMVARARVVSVAPSLPEDTQGFEM